MLFNKSEKADISIVVPVNKESNTDTLKKGNVITLENGDELGKIVAVINVKEKRYSAINQTLFYDYSENVTSVIIKLDSKVKRNDSLFYIGNTLCISPGSEIVIIIDDSEKITAQVDSISIKQ